MASEAQPFVRQIDPTKDTEKTYVICQETMGIQLRTGDVRIISPYIWNVPYVRLCPEYSWVLDNGSGEAVGYIHCAPNTASFVGKWREEYIPILESLNPLLKKPEMEPPADWGTDLKLGVLQLLYTPEYMMHPFCPKLVREYPAHLHIDILPEYQRMGFGKKLMEALWAKLRSDGVSGVHLVMEGANSGAEKFYMALGFERFNEVIDGGKSGQSGKEDNGNLWMVKKL